MVKAKTANRHRQAALALVNGTVSIGLMALAARLSHQPLVFPSLGPTAFLLFYRPYAEASCPRNALIGHLIGALAGLGSLAAFGLLDQGPALTHLGAARIGAAATSLGLTAGAMIWVGTPHPPAGATTLIVSLGLLTQPQKLVILMIAVVLLTVQAFVINRLAGIPYPLWSPRQDAPPQAPAEKPSR
jgi:CBS-domain-containing membrane protein